MNLLFIILAVWSPLVTHPVKDAATHEMLRVTASEPDRSVREEATGALRLIEDGNSPVETNRLAVVDSGSWTADEVREKLRAPAIHLQEAAVRAAARLNLAAAIPQLLPLLLDEDELLRRAVCETLVTVGPADRTGAVIKAVGQLLEVEPSALNRHAAVAVLTAIRNEAARQELLRLLKHDRWQTRLAAVNGIQKWNDPAEAEQVHPLLKDPINLVQAGAAEALGHLKNPHSEPVLLAHLPAAMDAAQVQTAWALGELRSVAVVPFLVEWVKSTNDALGVVAVEGLGKSQDERAVPALREVITRVLREQTNTRIAALRLLRELAVPGLAPRMVQFVTDPVVPPPPLITSPSYDSPAAREEAMRYLATFGTRADARAILVKLTEVIPAQLRPPLAELLTQLLQTEYRPEPDVDYRRYFVESRGPPLFGSPAPPGVVAVDESK